MFIPVMCNIINQSTLLIIMKITTTHLLHSESTLDRHMILLLLMLLVAVTVEEPVLHTHFYAQPKKFAQHFRELSYMLL